MPTKFVDFREVKSRVSIRDVLARYGFLESLKEKSRGKLAGACPIHGGNNPNSFHVSVEKNAFNCFTECGGGNVLDLVMKIEKCDIRDAGLKLADWFGIESTREATNRASKEGTWKREERVEATKRPAPGQAMERSGTKPEVEERSVNAPLDHKLKTLDYKHPYLTERGLTPETVKGFGVGYCSRGLMKGRIAIPIHNERGELVAYAGRTVDPEVAREKGKYLLPAGFQKGHVVYNLNRTQEHGGEGLIVVEGFFDCMKIWQSGFQDVVALMGATMTEQQEELLAAATDRLILMFDGDEAGVAGLRKVYARLRRRMFLKEVHLEDREQPDNLPAERIRALLG